MRRVLPPLNSLRVFEVAARHCNFTRAALELGVTQAAVSRQIGVLERWLGVELFERGQSKLALTDNGIRYWMSARSAFTALEDATAVLLKEPRRNTVVVCAYTTFALFWLLPRLSQFYKQYAHLDLQIITSSASVPASAGDADVIIRHGPIHQARGTSIFSDVLAPVCSPSLLRGRRSIKSIADLNTFPILHSRHRRQDWAKWCESLGMSEQCNDGHIFDGSSLAYEAAKQGLGVVMAQLHLVENDLESGALVMPIEHRMESDAGYFYLRSERMQDRAPVSTFCGWLNMHGSRSQMLH
jgi:LysR family glycine cleavage system transcriptional activator